MSMVFCRGCGHQIHETATACPKCGAVQSTSPPVVVRTYEQKLHLTMTVAAIACVVLLYTTEAIWLISIANGVCLGLSWALYVLHRRQGFKGTRKSDWILLVITSAVAFILMLADYYAVQAPVLVFFAARAGIHYFAMYSPQRSKPVEPPAA